jgi:flagellar biosynthesis/type III secretory pathway chaperone
MTSDNPAAASSLEPLVECLEAEYSALLAEDHERLEAVLARKEQLLAQLATLPAVAVGQPQSDRARAQTPWKQAIARVRELNRRNSVVLAPRAAGNSARLRFLQSALGRDALYGADGSVAPGRIRALQPRSV